MIQSSPLKNKFFWYLLSLPATLQSPTCWDFSKLLPVKINKFLSTPTMTSESRPEYEDSFLYFGASIPRPLQSTSLWPPQIHLEGPIRVFCSSQALHQNCPEFPHIFTFVFAPITVCQTLPHPSRSISSIFFPRKLPGLPQPELNLPVFWLLRPTHHSSFILRLLKFLCNRPIFCP